MFASIFKKVFGSHNDRLLKKLKKTVVVINGYEQAFEALSDNEIQAKTTEFKERLEKGESLEKIAPEAFAIVREASKRVFNMRHFDVQMKGGLVLH
ncbi:MAG: preprotein translocase subunit SecA, partial [Glaciecola sp.]